MLSGDDIYFHEEVGELQIFFKTVPNRPSIQAKHSKAVLKLIFLIKEKGICSRDYSSKNMSNAAFYFFMFYRT